MVWKVGVESGIPSSHLCLLSVSPTEGDKKEVRHQNKMLIWLERFNSEALTLTYYGSFIHQYIKNQVTCPWSQDQLAAGMTLEPQMFS